MVQLFSNYFSDYLLSDPVDKQRHLAGNFRGVSGRLCWIFKFCLDFFLSICWCLVLMLHTVG